MSRKNLRSQRRAPRKARKPLAPPISSRVGKYELWRLSWATVFSAPLPFPFIADPYFLRTVSIGGLGQVGYAASMAIKVFDGAGNTMAIFGTDQTVSCLAPTSLFQLTLSDSIAAFASSTSSDTLPFSQAPIPPSFLILPTMRWQMELNEDIGLLSVDGASVMIEYLPIDKPAVFVAP